MEACDVDFDLHAVDLMMRSRRLDSGTDLEPTSQVAEAGKTKIPACVLFQKDESFFIRVGVLHADSLALLSSPIGWVVLAEAKESHEGTLKQQGL